MKQALGRIGRAALFAIAAVASAEAAVPEGWFIAGSAPTKYDFDTDGTAAGEGAHSAFIRAKAADIAASGFGTLMQTIAADNFSGKRIRLSGMLRTQDATRGPATGKARAKAIRRPSPRAGLRCRTRS